MPKGIPYKNGGDGEMGPPAPDRRKKKGKKKRKGPQFKLDAGEPPKKRLPKARKAERPVYRGPREPEKSMGQEVSEIALKAFGQSPGPKYAGHILARAAQGLAVGSALGEAMRRQQDKLRRKGLSEGAMERHLGT